MTLNLILPWQRRKKAIDTLPIMKKHFGFMAERMRYSDSELQEFKELILERLAQARRDYEQQKSSITNINDTADTSPTFKILEEGANTLGKESAAQLANRQLLFINKLKAALVRIENKTYGICRQTGRLIPKERLRVVPHATLSIDAKNQVRK